MEKTLNEWISVGSDNIIAGCGRTLTIPISIKNTHPKERDFKIAISTSFKQKEGLIEWGISIEGKKTAEINSSSVEPKSINLEFSVRGDDLETLSLIIKTPRGGFKGDSMKLDYFVESKDGLNAEKGTISIILMPVFIALKTTVGNELQVSVDISNKSYKDMDERRIAGTNDTDNEIMSIVSPKDLRGYVFVETMHPDRVGFIAKGIKGFKGIVEGDIKFEEISHYLTPKPAVSGLELGSFVELIDGPFKGEKAKIMSIDKAKEEVTVQLVESMIPIPVTVRAEALRVLDRR